MTTRSMPIPPPACGGQPKRNDSMYDAIFEISVMKRMIEQTISKGNAESVALKSTYRSHDVLRVQ